VALLIASLHAGLATLAHRLPAAPLVEPPRPVPMTVELTRPPVPLPQAAQPAQPRPSAPPVRPAPHSAPPPHAVTRASAPQPAPGPATPSAATTPAVPPTPAPAPVAMPAPVRETAPVGDAAYLHNPAPDYPAVAQDQGWEGRVLLRVHVRADGTPDSVEVKTGSGRRLLDDAARAAVQHWVFVPAKRGDEAVDGWVNVPIDFRLG
jgi:periplasmic protein TonB